MDLNWAFNIFENLKIYNQIALKSFNFSNGFQIGLNWINPFKLDNSFLNIEWNNIPWFLFIEARLSKSKLFSSWS